MSIEAAFTQFPTLTTERLSLRQIQPGDIEALFAIMSDAEVMQYYGRPPLQSIEEARLVFAKIQQRYKQRTGLRWGITLRGEDRLIGSCTANRFDPDNNHAEVGYELDRAFWGQGIMTEAMSAVLTYCFTELDLHRVEANIDIVNERSKSLLLKLGFSYEGRLRERFFSRGRFEDEYYFGLLKNEWHPNQA